MTEPLTYETFMDTWHNYAPEPRPSVMIMSPEDYALTERYMKVGIAPTSIQYMGDECIVMHWPPLTIIKSDG